MKRAVQGEEKKSDNNGEFETVTVFGDGSWRKREWFVAYRNHIID